MWDEDGEPEDDRNKRVGGNKKYTKDKGSFLPENYIYKSVQCRKDCLSLWKFSPLSLLL